MSEPLPNLLILLLLIIIIYSNEGVFNFLLATSHVWIVCSSVPYGRSVCEDFAYMRWILTNNLCMVFATADYFVTFFIQNSTCEDFDSFITFLIE